MIRHRIGGAVAPGEQPIRLFVPNASQRDRIEVKAAPQPVRNVGQMHQIRAEGAFLNPAVQLAGIAAAHSSDEVRKVIVRAPIANSASRSGSPHLAT